MDEDTEKLVIHVDPDLEEIVPPYLSNRQKDVKLIETMVEQQDFESIRVLGHRMKGSGAGYGFDFISQVGRELEQAAKEERPTEIIAQMAALAAYLGRIDVRYT
ncbi:MAG: Hpt domain-containing protein [Magnetococcales bacterium]|nr:Hpt domain-containing protein [Magnetococcales bacterium]